MNAIDTQKASMVSLKLCFASPNVEVFSHALNNIFCRRIRSKYNFFAKLGWITFINLYIQFRYLVVRFGFSINWKEVRSVSSGGRSLKNRVSGHQFSTPVHQSCGAMGLPCGRSHPDTDKLFLPFTLTPPSRPTNLLVERSFCLFMRNYVLRRLCRATGGLSN